jgi:hypothetical protein
VPVIPVMREVQGWPEQKCKTISKKITKTKRDANVAQVVKFLLARGPKFKTPVPSSSTTEIYPSSSTGPSQVQMRKLSLREAK